MTPENFDAIIIGTGQSGKPLAIALGNAGWKTVVIERKHVGGTCINYGCTPTKTMVASARVAYLARRGQDYGVHAGGDVRVDMAEVYRRKQGVVEQFRNGGQRYLESTPNVELLFGEGSFVDAKTIRVALNAGGERLLTAPKIVVNTGGRPAVPPIPGLADVRFLDSTSIMELETLPAHLVVLGGGYIGLEFSQMFRRFGARVTIVNRDDRLIPREDPDVSAEVEKILTEDGIEIVNRAGVTRVEGRNGVQLAVETPAGAKRIDGSHLLVAIGRTPNSDRLNLAVGGNRDRQGRLHPGEQPARDERARHLRDRRREGRAGVHAHLLRRLPRPARELAREAQRHDRRPARAEHHVHRSAARDRRPERDRSREARRRLQGGEDADELRRPRDRDGRDARLHEGDRRSADRADPRVHRSSASRAAS